MVQRGGFLGVCVLVVMCELGGWSCCRFAAKVNCRCFGSLPAVLELNFFGIVFLCEYRYQDYSFLVLLAPSLFRPLDFLSIGSFAPWNIRR